MSIWDVATMIKVGLAYLVEVPDAGSFVCFDFWALNNPYRLLGSTYLRLNPAPVQYPIVAGYMRNERDCVLWASNEMGVESPWGRGCLTVNTKYILEEVFTP